MLCALPLMRGRVMAGWCLLALAYLAAVHTPSPWWLIDAAGAVVFASWPGWHPRLIAVLFAAMMVADISHPAPWLIGMALGWIQWTALLLWAVHRMEWHPTQVTT